MLPSTPTAVTQHQRMYSRMYLCIIYTCNVYTTRAPVHAERWGPAVPQEPQRSLMSANCSEPQPKPLGRPSLRLSRRHPARRTPVRSGAGHGAASLSRAEPEPGRAPVGPGTQLTGDLCGPRGRWARLCHHQNPRGANPSPRACKTFPVPCRSWAPRPGADAHVPWGSRNCRGDGGGTQHKCCPRHGPAAF